MLMTVNHSEYKVSDDGKKVFNGAESRRTFVGERRCVDDVVGRFVDRVVGDAVRGVVVCRARQDRG